jgi:hypothetical protein
MKYFKLAGATELDNNNICCAYDLLQVPRTPKNKNAMKKNREIQQAFARKRLQSQSHWI